MSDIFPALRSLGEVGPHDIERVVPTEIVDGIEIRGIVHDESARMFAQKRRAVGHAGLFSTAPDLLNFLGSASARKMLWRSLSLQPSKGWAGKRRGRCSSGQSARRTPGQKTGSFGKTGFTGTSVVVESGKGRGSCYPIESHVSASSTWFNCYPFVSRGDLSDIVLG